MVLVVRAYATILGLLTGTSIDVDVPKRAPLLAQAGIGVQKPLEYLELTARPTGSFAPFPVQGGFIKGAEVSLGWKLPALLLAPLWMLRAPTLLPLLLLIWLRAPNPNASALQWEGFVSSSDLQRGIWRFMLGRVLDGIGRSSLPGILATTNADGTTNPFASLPRSTCTGVHVAKGGKLVLDGKLERFQLAAADLSRPELSIAALPGGSASSAQVVEDLEYTLRMGVRVERPDGVRSALIWDTPELKLSLGDSLFARLLPQLWVPVMATSGGVLLPRAIDVHRVTVSDAGDGITASGTLDLGGGGVGGDDGVLALARV